MKRIHHFLLWLFIFLPLAVQAEDAAPTTVLLPNPIKATTIPGLANSIIIGILGIIGAFALLAFVWGGLLWMTSMGNADRVKQGKDTLIYATLGLLVIFISYSVIYFIFDSLGK